MTEDVRRIDRKSGPSNSHQLHLAFLSNKLWFQGLGTGFSGRRHIKECGLARGPQCQGKALLDWTVASMFGCLRAHVFHELDSVGLPQRAPQPKVGTVYPNNSLGVSICSYKPSTFWASYFERFERHPYKQPSIAMQETVPRYWSVAYLPI